jgi:hypothetical protein
MCAREVREIYEVTEGISLHQVMLDRNPEIGNWPRPTACVFGGDWVLRKHWKTTTLGATDVAVFTELPMGGGGGGSNPLQAIFMVAVMVVAVVTQQYYVGPWAAATFGAGSAAASVVSGLTAAGIMIGGGLLSNAIFGSIPSGQLDSFQNEAASPTYNINGASNQARLWQPEPEQFGKMRIVPDIVATQWSQYIGNEMYLYQVFGCGRGSYEQHTLGYGDVIFWQDGNYIPSAYTTESGEQYTNSIDQTLTQVVDGGDTYGPYVAVPVGDKGLKINLTLDFPDGLCTWEWIGFEENEPSWRAIPATAVVEVSYRDIDDSGAPISGWKVFGTYTITETKTLSFSRLYTISTDTYQRYEISVRNLSTIPDNSTHTDPASGTIYSMPNIKTIVLTNVSANLLGIRLQILEPGQPVTLFPDNVDTSVSVASQELLAPNAGGTWIGPFPTNSPGTKVSQILYSYVFPGGLGQYDDKGRLKPYTVTLQIQLQEIDDNGLPVSDWVDLDYPTYTAGTLTAQRFTEPYYVTPARYQTQVRRVSDKREDNRAVETVQWGSLTAIIPGSLTYDQTVIAIKIRASNTLSQQAASSFAVVQTRKLPLYDRATKTWSDPQPTRSAAAAISQICRADYGGALPDNQIDLDTLWALGEELDDMGWYFDAWIDGAYTIWQLLVEVCNALRLVPRPAGSMLSFVMDKSGRPVRHVFTPRDIVRGSL